MNATAFIVSMHPFLRSVKDDRLKEHHQHMDKSAMAEHSINLGHCIQLHNTSILSTEHTYMDSIIREVTETELYPNNMNKDPYRF
jgi:hypothetical protein